MRYICLFLSLVSSHPVLSQDNGYLIDTIAGSDPATDGGLARNAVFGDVRGITVTPAGDILISDTARHRVHRISPDGRIRVVAGLGHSGFSGDGGPAEQAALNQPYGIATEPGGAILIADLGNRRVRRVTPDGRIQTIADAGLRAPRNLTVDATGAVYISDFEAHQVLRLGRDGQLTVHAGSGRGGSVSDGPAMSAAFAYPAGLAADPGGGLYVSDSNNHMIRKIAGGMVTAVRFPSAGFVNLPTGLAMDAAGGLIVAATGFEQTVRLRASGAAEIVFRGVIHDVAADSAGNLYLACGAQVRKVSPSGLVTTIAGLSGQFRGDDGPANQALLSAPMDVQSDRAGGWLIADTGNHRIRRIAPDGTITTIAGDGTPGFSGDGGPAAAARLSSPQSVIADPAGNIYVADTGNHRIRRITPQGTIATCVGTGLAGFNGDLKQALDSQLSSPSFVTVDANGWLVIADTGNHRVRRVLPGGLTVNAAGAGTAGYSGDGGSANTTQLRFPRGLATDRHGNIFFADSGNHRIRRIAPTGIISTVLGDGRQTLANPIGLAIDSSGALYIGDADNQRVRRITTDGIISTIAGSGLRGFAGDGTAAADARLDDPSGIAVDSSGAVVFADRLNHRIRRLIAAAALPPPPPPPPPSVSSLRILHPATQERGAIAPGMMVTIEGPGIGPANPLSGRLGPDGSVETALGGVEVRFDGRPAPVLYAQSNLVNVQTPYRLAGQSATMVEVLRDGVSKGQVVVEIVPAAPGIFTVNGNAAAVNEDMSINSAAQPAAAGSLLTFYMTGEGLADPTPPDGTLSVPPYPAPVLPLEVSIGGNRAETVSLGVSATSPGITQVTVRVPLAVAEGSQMLQVVVAGTPSQRNVPVFVRAAG